MPKASRVIVNAIDKLIGKNSNNGGVETIKLLRVMRLTAIILLSACLAASARGFTQTLTLNVKDAPLEKVLAEIKKQTGYSFVYASDLNDKARKVTVQLKNVGIEEALKECFKQQPFTYKIINKVVIVNTEEIVVSPKEDATSVAAPTLIDISGKVTDTEGNPLAGASVKIRGTKLGTTTSNDGSFALKAIEENVILEISFVGYQTYTKKLLSNGGALGTITLKINPEKLGEIIINKGYYTEKETLSPSHVGKVTAKEIEKQPVTNVLFALQARVPGLFITQASGIPGAGVKVRIQGQNSIKNGNAPIYIIDGVPIESQLPTTGAGMGQVLSANARMSGGLDVDPLSFLNPSDIESVEVLKDADATAIYGSRAANGAILITTKKGKAGSMKLDLNMQTGWGRVARHVNMMNTRQYLDMRYEAFRNDNIDWTSTSVSAKDLKVWDTTQYTDWKKELIGGTAHYNNFNASVSGGTNSVRYLVSGTYSKVTTVFPLPKDFADQKAAVHFNLNTGSDNQKLHMQFSGNYLFDDNKLPLDDMTMYAMLKEPNAPSLLHADGSLNWAPDATGTSTVGTFSNPMTRRYLKYVNKTYNLLSNLKLDYTILPGLNVGSSFGYNFSQTNEFQPSPLIAVAPELRPTTQRSAAFGNRNYQSWIIEPQASYQTKINKGTLDVLVGSTFQDNNANASYIVGQGQISDELLDNINAAATIIKGNGSNSSYRYNAIFGRANYNWADKYILSLNVRRDGSTSFGEENRFHNFGSIGGAWIFSDEPFIKSYKSWFSFGKLRGSYGTTGNDQIGDYLFMSMYNLSAPFVPYQGIIGLFPDNISNPGLEWEETRKLQLGIDLGFLQDRLNMNATWVRNRSSNQLLSYKLPAFTGFEDYIVNFPATVQNQNWEFVVSGKVIKRKNFTWTSNVNLTIPRNTLLEFPDIENSTYKDILIVGEPIDAGKSLHWLGVGSGTGEYLFEDHKGNPIVSPSFILDRTIVISQFPKLYGGFINTITYNNIQLDFTFQFVKQTGRNDLSFWNGGNAQVYPGMFAAGQSNQPLTVLDHWQKPGDVASVAKYSTNQLRYVPESDRSFTDASYVRLKNVSLSCDLPQKWMDKVHFRHCQIYLHGQNLLTFTKYKGLDPETQSMNALPPLQIWTLGFQLGL